MSNNYIGEPPSTLIDDQDHFGIKALLYEYVSIQLLGQLPHPDWYPLKQHLLGCPSCRSEADALLQLMRASYQGDIRMNAQLSEPDLAFLRPSPEAAHTADPSTPEVRYHPILIQFFPALLPTIRVALTARSGIDRLLYAYRIPPESPSDPDITVEVLARDEQSEHGLVRITVELSDSDPFEQAGSAVTLSAVDLHLSAITDQNGVARFDDVPLDQIGHWRISVTPPHS
jgi:hypothetical protein